MTSLKPLQKFKMQCTYLRIKKERDVRREPRNCYPDPVMSPAGAVSGEIRRTYLTVCASLWARVRRE